MNEPDLAAIEARLARLEAKEAVLDTFNQYLYALDTGHGEQILDSFCEDAVLDVINFPPADGADLHYEGRDAMPELFRPYGEREPSIGGGHHTANIAINVRTSLDRADVSSYFMTTRNVGVQGGRYEGIMRLDPDGRWRWETLTIISSWGWTTDTAQVSDRVGIEQSPRAGRPARYEP